MQLSAILDPVGLSSFFSEYFETKPLLVARNACDHFREILNLDDIDRLLTTLSLRYPDVSLVNAERAIDTGEYTFADGTIDVAQLLRLHDEGATIILNHLHTYHPPLADLCAALELDFSAPVQTNIYMTPPCARGFKAHFDTHDVFILQVHGSKRWRLYDTPIPLPVEGQSEDAEVDDAGMPAAEFELTCGDTLYIPRGLVHDAVSSDDTSVHVTVGALFFTWSDLMLEALAQTVLADPAFRRALPVDFARPDFDRTAAPRAFRDLAQRFAGSADFDAVMASFVEAFTDRRRPRLRGQLAQIRRLAQLGPDSLVSQRPLLACTLQEDAVAIRLHQYGKDISIPREAADALRFALATPAFRVCELPGLDPASQLVLVRRLIREGILLAGAHDDDTPTGD